HDARRARGTARRAAGPRVRNVTGIPRPCHEDRLEPACESRIRGSVTARAGSSRKLVVTNRDDLELLGTARGAHGNHIADRSPEQSRSDRRYPGDTTGGRIDLVGPDDADRALAARLVGHRYRRTQVERFVVFAGVVDHHRAIDALIQKSDPSIISRSLRLP